MAGKSVGFLYAATAMCRYTPGYKAIWYFATNESRNDLLALAKKVLPELAPEAVVKFTTGNIEFPNGSVLMLRATDGAVGDVAHKVEIDDEGGKISDWMYGYLKTRERL